VWGLNDGTTVWPTDDDPLQHRPHLITTRKTSPTATPTNTRRKSLAIRWIEAVLDELQRVVAWPVKSLKLDDLMAAYKTREQRDACRLSYQLLIGADATIQSVTSASAGGACAAPVMVPDGAAPGGFVVKEIPVEAGGAATLPLVGLKWNVSPK